MSGDGTVSVDRVIEIARQLHAGEISMDEAERLVEVAAAGDVALDADGWPL